MNALPRFLAMALFVVLAVLFAMLSVPLWHRIGADGKQAAGVEKASGSNHSADRPPNSRPTADAASGNVDSITGRRSAMLRDPHIADRSARMAVVSGRVELGVAAVGLALALALLFSFGLKPLRADTGSSLAAVQREIGTLARLAKRSTAQGAELSRERDVRRRAEQDAELKQTLLSQSLEERTRLGRDLHDGIMQSLYAMGLALEMVRPLVKRDPADAEQLLKGIRDTLNDAIRDVRSCIGGLTPEQIVRSGFSQYLASRFEELRMGRNVGIELNIDEEAAAALSSTQTLEALQIAREAISNALRHGKPTKIIVRMHRSDTAVSLLVQDDGKGFDPDRAHPDGHGLSNIRARAAQVGADLRITSQPGHGTRVVTTLTCPPQCAA